MAAAKAGAIIKHLMLFCTQESDRIVDQKITLHFIGKMSAGDKFKSGGWSNFVFFFNKSLELRDATP